MKSLETSRDETLKRLAELCGHQNKLRTAKSRQQTELDELNIGTAQGEQEDLLDLITRLLKFNCFLSTTVATQCTFQSSVSTRVHHCGNSTLQSEMAPRKTKKWPIWPFPFKDYKLNQV